MLDLSKLDFESHRSRFSESKHQITDLEVHKAATRAQVKKLLRLKTTCADLAGNRPFPACGLGTIARWFDLRMVRLVFMRY